MDVALYEIKYYYIIIKFSFNFLQIIVMIIIYKSLNYFTRANAVRKAYKYSLFCIKLTYIAVLRYRGATDEVCFMIFL